MCSDCEILSFRKEFLFNYTKVTTEFDVLIVVVDLMCILITTPIYIHLYINNGKHVYLKLVCDA